MNNCGFFSKVYHIVKQIPYGKVMTYGQIATILGCPHNSRAVGYALHANKHPMTIPCHRVINSKGMVSSGYAFGGLEVQRELLEKEGIVFNEYGKTDLKKFLWEVKNF
jgi:methylated-DNA-protein-cysteine methyltransferase-like protein